MLKTDFVTWALVRLCQASLRISNNIILKEIKQISSQNTVQAAQSQFNTMYFSKSDRLRKRAHKIISGGYHTHAKGNDQYPQNTLGFICKGEGCHVTDVDGNEFIEYCMGLRSETLGHERIAQAAYEATLRRSNFLRPSPIEVQLAETMLSLLAYGAMIKFGKNGSEVMMAAIKLARAYTIRDIVAVPSSQASFSVDDWFIGTTAMNAGIPQQVQDLTTHFKYNDIDSVKALFDRHPDEIACLIMEPAKYDPTKDDFLHRTKELCRQYGGLFILDEIITKFRWDLNGAQHFYDIDADLSTFGKAEIMEAGGIKYNKERVFLLSQSFGTVTSSMAVALETIQIYQEENVVDYMWDIGRKLEQGIKEIVKELKFGGYFTINGYPCAWYSVPMTKTNNTQKSSVRFLFRKQLSKAC